MPVFPQQRSTGTRHGWQLLAVAALMALLGAMTTARAASVPGNDFCGFYTNQHPLLAPMIDARLTGPASDPAFGCLVWQSFIYLNWPARAPGVPDPERRFGSAGATVWETYKRHDEVFLPDGVPPSPWGEPDRTSGGARVLTQTHQTGGGVLVDRGGRPVYYEMLMNRDEFAYITANKLYDADTQLAFAEGSGIVLPAGPTATYGPVGAIEIKAAWKVLSPEELASRPRRFHTAEALLEDGTHATVGLVGFHINQRVEGFTQGVWATFAQIDNAPLAGADDRGRHYSFYDPACIRCPANVETAPPQATQVEQRFPAAPSVAEANAFVRDLVRAADPDSPWQFYELLGVQWPQFVAGQGTPMPEPLHGASRRVPLSIGNPSSQTLVNPVLETFSQSENVSCLGCHGQGGTARATEGGPLAADYSFLFAHAQSPAPPASR